jgi:hypothetical protein
MTSTILLLIAAAALGQEPVRVGATLSSPTVHVGETAVLEISVATHGTEPDSVVMPILPPGLQSVSTADFSESQFSMPGGRSQILRRQIGLVARGAGRYQIPAVAVWVRGRRYVTPALVLTVSGAPSPRMAFKGRGPGEEVVLQASATPQSVFVGEQVTLHVDALFSEDVRSRLRSAPEYQPPNPSGFWVYELPNPISVDFKRVKDQFYEVQTFRRAYFPLTAGSFVLPPAKLLYEVREGFLNTPETRELTSESIKLDVKPLPTAGRPAAFNGAVGRFLARAQLDPAQVPAGEPATLTLEVEGQGNMKSLPPPALPQLPGVQIYPPSEDTHVDMVDGVVKGSKRFSWVLIPQRPGRLEVPSLEYAYFDPSRQAYGVSRTPTLYLDVSPGGATPRVSRNTVTLRPIAMHASGPDVLRWVRSREFAMLQAVPLLAVLGLAWRRRSRARPRRTTNKQLRARIDARLAELDADAGQITPNFFAALETEFRAWLAERFNNPSLRTAHSSSIVTLLESAGVDGGRPAATAAFIEAVDHARYSPTPPDAQERRNLVARARTLVEQLDGQRERRRTQRRARIVALLLGSGSLLGVTAGSTSALQVPSAASPSGDSLFGAGLHAYNTGDSRTATEAFARFVRAHPDDAAAWYNLGNAAYRNGERGRAVWAWLRSLGLEPRNRDARANLDLVNADAELITRTGLPLPLSSNETLLLASIAWFVACITALLYFALPRGRRSAAFVASLAVLIALTLFGTVAFHSAQSPYAVVVAKTTPLRAAPEFRADLLRVLGGGDALHVTARQNDWVRVKTTDGTEGWVEAGRVGWI